MIRVLSEETINQIAAGEVVERPLSIVKELLENAIDAGASSLSIEIKDGGLEMIRITDNGSGIESSEVKTAFLRHATSKLREASDLSQIHTLGFRGEALASIAAVSKVELITKRESDLLGTHYLIEGGQEKEFSEIGAPDGSTLIVRDLFFNVPARKKFLKSSQTEAARIQDIVEKEALAHPELAFRYIQDGKMRLQTLGNGSLLDVVYAIFGREIASQLITVDKGFSPSALTGIPKIQVKGFIGKPTTNRSNRNYEIYFVNSRYVHDKLLQKAIEDGYRAFLMQHKFPFTVLFLSISPELVDVNVHPQKLEVRFSDGLSIYNAVVEAIDTALKEEELIVNTDLEKQALDKEKPSSESKNKTVEKLAEPFEKKRALEQKEKTEQSLKADIPDFALPRGYRKEDLERRDFNVGEDRQLHDSNKAKGWQQEVEKSFSQNNTRVAVSGEKSIEKHIKEERPQEGAKEELIKKDTKKEETVQEGTEKKILGVQETLFTDRFLSEKARLSHRIIGQLFDTYWLIEYGDKLFIIDQHAAHEKVNFERMMKRMQEKKPVSQYLNPPILLSLGSEEGLLLSKYKEYFEGLGYEIEPMGARDFSIRAIPADLPELEKKDLLLEILADLSEETAMTTAESIYHKIATMSCKAAVKGNNRLSFMEMDALVEELLSLDNPYACPHGRPTIISMSKYELEKKFKRIV